MNAFNKIILKLDNPVNDPNNEIDIVEVIAKQFNYPLKIVRNGIKQRQLKKNDKTIFQHKIYLTKNLKLTFQGKYVKLPLLKQKTRFDKYVEYVLSELFDLSNIDNLYSDQQIKFEAFILLYFDYYDYDPSELKESYYSEIVLKKLSELYNNKINRIESHKKLKRKNLVEELLSIKNSEIINFEKIISSVVTEVYSVDSNNIYQDFNHQFKRAGFKFLITPTLDYKIKLTKIVDIIITNYKKVRNENKKSEIFKIKSNTFNKYQNLVKSNFENKDDRISKGFIEIINFFKSKCEEKIGIEHSEDTMLEIIPEDRTYNLDNMPITVHAILSNCGSGICKNIHVTEILTQINSTISAQVISEFLIPDQKMKVRFQINNIQHPNPTKEFALINFNIKWKNEFDNESVKCITNFKLKKQKEKLPWDDLRRTSPYGLKIVNDPERLFGRERLINDLKWNIQENTTINSYIFYGQKRVGKSSIIRTIDTIYQNNPNVFFIYKTIGDLANTNSLKTFQSISKSISKSLISQARKKLNRESFYNDIANELSFSGSLEPVKEVIDKIHEINDKIRIIIAIDEFDELNKEFFEDSVIGKTLALNIGKGLNEKSHVGFILIGSENMVYKTKQGMRLNAFENKRVDTFDKHNEFESYCNIITEPTKSCLDFSSDVLNLLFDYTNGNPYYTNLLCDKIFRKAYEYKASFIDVEFVHNIIYGLIHHNILIKKDFEHFWCDGISEDTSTNIDKTLDRRCRLLTAYALAKKDIERCRWQEIKKKINYPNIYQTSELQMEDTLNDFKQRNIFIEDDEKYLKIIPKLFDEWLEGPGLYQVIAELEEKDVILDKILSEEKMKISKEELEEVSNILYDNCDGKYINSVKLFLNQFHNNVTKKKIIELLRKTVVISESDTSSYLKRVRKIIWPEIEIKLGEQNIRKDSEIVCLQFSYDQNIDYVNFIKKIFKFSNKKSIKREVDFEIHKDDTKKIILFEPLIDCPNFYRNEISKFLKKINPLYSKSTTIHIICFIITEEAKNELEILLSDKLYFNYRIHFLKLYQRTDISPYFNRQDAINDPTWKELTKIYPDLNESCCLVKTGSIIPYQCYPFLWSDEIKSYNPLIRSNAKIKDHENMMSLSKILKDLIFETEDNKLELKASFFHPAINWKGIKKLCDKLKSCNQNNSSNCKEIKRDIVDQWKLKMPGKENIKYQIKHSIAKNISAFANSNGGDIYIGIEDDFTVQGLIYDMKSHKSKEEILNLLDSLINDYIGKDLAAIIRSEFIDINSKYPVLKIKIPKLLEVRVKIDKNGKPLGSNNGESYIRGQQGAYLLSAPPEYHEWIENRKKEFDKPS
jgi:schlafen family protein